MDGGPPRHRGGDRGHAGRHAGGGDRRPRPHLPCVHRQVGGHHPPDEEAVLVQLENVKNGEISQLEYESSINAIINSLESYKDDQDMLQSFYLGQKIVGTDYDIDTLKEKISKVTMEDAARVFKNVKLETVYFLTGKEDA